MSDSGDYVHVSTNEEDDKAKYQPGRTSPFLVPFLVGISTTLTILALLASLIYPTFRRSYDTLILPYCALCGGAGTGQHALPHVAVSSTEPQFAVVTLDPTKKWNLSHGQIHRSGLWEPHVYAELKKELKETQACEETGSTVPHFVDLGSNVGFFSLYAASLGCNVLAVDGNEEMLKRLRASVSLNELGKTKAGGRGFNSDHFKVERLFLTDSSTTGRRDYTYGKSTVTNVPTKTIDQLFVQYGVLREDSGTNNDKNQVLQQLHLVKMDIESSVSQALRGAQSALRERAAKKWLIELWDVVGLKEWISANMVKEWGYVGRLTCCASASSACSWAKGDVKGFERAWGIAWPKDAARDLCDAVFE